MIDEEDNDKEEEISIDFSKLKKIFNKSKEEKINETENKKDGQTYLNKAKNILSKIREKPQEGEEVSFDFRKVTGFFKKHKNVLVPLVFILIAMIFSIHLRIQTAYLPITDRWASDNVNAHFKSQISSQINQQYPNLPQINKQSMVEAEFQKLLKERKSEIDEQIKATSDYFKSRLQDENGQTYLLAIDPYFWMRHADNILKNGHPGDEIINGIKWDNHMRAPIGRQVPTDMLNAYFEAYLYKFVSFFDRDVSLMAVIFYVPIILSALAIIPAFFITKRFGGNFGGFVAALVLAIHPEFLKRTIGGFSDTDAYAILFPLLITWTILIAFESKDLKNKSLFASISAILVGIYSFAWSGWWYIFDFVVASSIIYILYYLILHWGETKKNILSIIKIPAIRNTLIITLIFIIISGLFVSLFIGFTYFKRAPLNPIRFSRLKQVATIEVWPNVYTSVSEQMAVSLRQVIEQIGTGGWALFLIGIVGIGLSMVKKNSKRISDLWFVIGSSIWFAILLTIQPENLKLFLALISIPFIIKFFIMIKQKDFQVNIQATIILLMWFMSAIYATTKGARFSLILVPAFAIGIGISLGMIFKYLSKLITEGLNINKWISRITLFILLLLILGILPIPPFCGGSICGHASAYAKIATPTMNDAWYEVLTKIKEESAPDAIINSWWDFGHWFKMVGDRPVTFDGTSQDTPMAHWIGNALVTNDENTSIGILRMLDCGSRKAGDILDEITHDTAMSVDIIYKIILQDKENAKKTLLDYNLDQEQAESVLDYTHCQPPDDYFIVSGDMGPKSITWGHFGSWDFDKALAYYTLRSKEYKNNPEKSIEFIQERFGYPQKDAENLFYEVQSISTNDEADLWIAPLPTYSQLANCPVSDKQIKCENGLTIDPQSYDVTTQNENIIMPFAIIYPTENTTIIKRFNNSAEFSITLIPTGPDSFTSLLSYPTLAESMYTRLYHLQGHGLKHFKLFASQRQITGDYIYVYKVDWEGKEKNIITFFETANETIKTSKDTGNGTTNETIELNQEIKNKSIESMGDNENATSEKAENKSSKITNNTGKSINNTKPINGSTKPIIPFLKS